MSDTQVGRITFGTVHNPAAWDIGDSSYLTFGSPTEAKRAEELFTAMQRELAAKAEECERVRNALDALICVIGLTAFRYENQRAVAQEAVDQAIAALREAK